jgi:hypothetical protein
MEWIKINISGSNLPLLFVSPLFEKLIRYGWGEYCLPMVLFKVVLIFKSVALAFVLIQKSF